MAWPARNAEQSPPPSVTGSLPAEAVPSRVDCSTISVCPALPIRFPHRRQGLDAEDTLIHLDMDGIR